MQKMNMGLLKSFISMTESQPFNVYISSFVKTKLFKRTSVYEFEIIKHLLPWHVGTTISLGNSLERY